MLADLTSRHFTRASSAALISSLSMRIGQSSRRSSFIGNVWFAGVVVTVHGLLQYATMGCGFARLLAWLVSNT
jgi:hypothetical protein